MIEGVTVSLYEKIFGESWMQMKPREKGPEMESVSRLKEKVCFRMINSRASSYI